MKTNTSTALVIPQTLVPKPTKTDILNAMVERARGKHEAEAKKLKDAKEEAGKKIEVFALAEFERHPPTPKVDIYGWGDGVVELEFRVKSPTLTKMIAAYNKMPTLRGFDEAETRKQIREGMNSLRPSGVQALLGNKEAVKALDASLAHIGL